MKLKKRIGRIQEMEEAFDAGASALRACEQGLAELEQAQDALAKLSAYYGSEEWFADRDADEAGELPDALKRGVLGEDLPYELLVDYRQLGIRMLEVATRALKDA